MTTDGKEREKKERGSPDYVMRLVGISTSTK
jgi:hypothetical protein